MMFEGIDLGSVTLVGLAIIGAVNAWTLWRKQASSQEKFMVSVVVALLVGFIPADLGSVILERIVAALSAAFVASGGYKLTQKLGGQ